MTKRLMRKLTTAATLGAAALLLAAPGQAQAQDSSLSVSPHTVRPGATVTITQFCNPKQPDVIVESDLFGKLPMKEEAAAGTQAATYHTSVTIPADAKHGSHKLSGSCGTSTTLTVSPTGGVSGGTGLDTTDNGALIAAGVGTLAAAGGGGLWLLRRRGAGAPAG